MIDLTATIDNTNHTNKRWYEAEYSDTCVKIYLSHVNL